MIFVVLLTISKSFFAQNVSLYEQFSGRVDFTFIGNTLNTIENNNIDGQPEPPCLILTSSSASLNLDSNNIIEKAFLYWAGSGTGDFTVKLNNQDIIPERTFGITTNLTRFSAFANVTNLVQTTGNGLYTFSDLDLSSVIDPFCPTGSNFGGWAIVIVYKNNDLPINQLNIYDGLESVPDVLNITLNSLNVIDNVDAKIGFVAWEGDKNIQVNETLRINGTILSNLLNPTNNAFNGTNTITGSDQLFNMDLDIYDIQNNINIGDNIAEIELTSSQDFVMINVIVTKLNSQLPDATITFNNIQQTCGSRQIKVDYVVSNSNATDFLPANTPIAFYANNILVGTSSTSTIIPIDGNISSQITLNIPNSIPANFVLNFVIDDIGNGVGIVAEIIETNNNFSQNFSFYVVPKFNNLPDINLCKDVLENTFFNFSNYKITAKVVDNDIVSFHETYQNAFDNQNPILNIYNYPVNQFTKTIYVRLQNENCFNIMSFNLNIVLYPKFNILPGLNVCKQSATSSFDFSNYVNIVKVNATDIVSFYDNDIDAINNTNPILNTSKYIPSSIDLHIYVRIDNGVCYSKTSFKINYFDLPKFNIAPNLESCDQGLTLGFFDFSSYLNTVKVNQADNVSFYLTENDAINSTFPLSNLSNYYSDVTPKKVFIRIENGNLCYNTTSFDLTTKRCPVKVYNAVSANSDGKNDYFFIDGLRDIYLDFETEIYNRWGQLVWKGNNNISDFNGFSNVGVHIDNKLLPEGNYFYVLNLNDLHYPKPITGYLYLSR